MTCYAFGLTNAPSTPMCLIYNVLRKYLRKHVVVFMDDIIIPHVKLILIIERTLILVRVVFA